MTDLGIIVEDERTQEPLHDKWTEIDFEKLDINRIDSVELLSNLFSDTPVIPEQYCGFTAYRGRVDGEQVFVGYKNHRGDIIPGAPISGPSPSDPLGFGTDFYCRVTHEHLG